MMLPYQSFGAPEQIDQCLNDTIAIVDGLIERRLAQ
jgi:hypothetical protein